MRRTGAGKDNKLTRVGTLDYMAPQILMQNDDDEEESSYTVLLVFGASMCAIPPPYSTLAISSGERHGLSWQSKSVSYRHSCCT